MIIADSRVQIIIPLLKKCIDQHYSLQDEILPMIARNMGIWLNSLNELLSTDDRRWFLRMYCRLSALGCANTTNTSSNSIMTKSDSQMTLSAIDDHPIHLACRRACAYNFPVYQQLP